MSKLNIENAEHGGIDVQSVQCCQELAELIVAITKKNRESIIEEIADVEVMLEQMKYFYKIPEKQVNKTKKYKIKRQRKRIQELTFATICGKIKE